MRQVRLVGTALAALVFAACGNTLSKTQEIGHVVRDDSRLDAELIPLALAQYKGKPCTQYPDLAFIERLGSVNVFWMGGENCANDAGVDQQAVLASGRLVAGYVNEGIQRFLELAVPVSSEWKRVIEEKVLPIDLHIRMTEWGGAMATGVADVNVYSVGQTRHLSKRRYIVVNALMDAHDVTACETVVMHEVGHCISAGVGRLSNNNLLEEAWADIVGTATAHFSTRFGDGYGLRLRSRYESLLARTDLTSQRRALIEARRAGTSQRAYRDFTNPMSYPELYSVPEPHVISSYVNHLRYRVGAIVGDKALARSFFALYLSNPDSFVSGDVYQFMSSALSPWADNLNVQAILAELKWQPSVSSSGKFHFGWESSAISEHQKLLRIVNDETLKADIFPGAFLNPFMTLQFQGTPLLSFATDYAYSDWADPKSQVVLAAEPRSEPCPSPSATCLCDSHWNDVTFFGTYKSRDGRVHRTASQGFSPPQASNSTCYDLSVMERQ